MQKNHNSPTLISGGVEDHVHVLCRPGKTMDVSDLIRETKKGVFVLGKGRVIDSGVPLASRIWRILDQPQSCSRVDDVYRDSGETS
jgi:hypothetical protein